MYRLLQRFTSTGLFALQFFLLGQAAIADIPRTLSYQGILTDNSGTVVADSDYDLTFTLYDASSGGNAVWTETHTLTVIDGLFSAALGAQTALDIPFDTPYWLGIAIDAGNDLDPRTPLTASAYALGVATSVLDGIHTLSSADGSITGALFVNNNGNVGINTRTPRDLLDVRSRSAAQSTLDQSQETFNTVTTANDVWQSFTPDRTGEVTSIEVFLDDPFSGAAPAAGIFEIYEGEGTAGTRLHDGPVDIADLPDSAFVTFSVDLPVPVSADSIYTFRLSVPASNQEFVELSNSNPYLGGRASTGTDDDLAFKVSINDPLPILHVTDERVGIGTDAPNSRLHINGDATEPSLRVQVDGVSRLTVAANGGVSIGGFDDSPSGNLEIRQLTDSEDDADLDNFGIVIRNNQNDTGKEVGIGFRISSDPEFPPGAAITHERTGTNSVGKLHFKTSPAAGVLTTRMTIDESGDVGISHSSPTAGLHMKQAADDSDAGIKIERSADTFAWEIINGNDKDLRFQHSDLGGSIHFDDEGFTVTAPSDGRLKKNIEPIQDALVALDRLEPVQFHFRHVADDRPKSIGFIAQDVERVVPGMVTENDAGYKAVAYSQFSVLAIAAIRELHAIVQQQRDLIEDQSGQIERLEAHFQTKNLP